MQSVEFEHFRQCGISVLHSVQLPPTSSSPPSLRHDRQAVLLHRSHPRPQLTQVPFARRWYEGTQRVQRVAERQEEQGEGQGRHELVAER